MTQHCFDAIVIGAGPAGCVLALRLAEMGHAVALVERRPFPRPHIGVSFTPGVAKLLAAHRIAADAVPHRVFPGRIVDWADGGPQFRPEPPAGAGITVDRGAFDAALCGAAVARGAAIFQPAHIAALQHDGPSWSLALETPDGPVRLAAAVLADATGRTGLLGRRRRPIGPPLLAVHAVSEGAAPDELPQIAAGPEGWCWVSPLPDGRRLAIGFLDPGPPGKSKPAARLSDLFEACGLAGKLGDGLVSATAAGAWFDDNAVGHDFIKLGDAVLATDPLSASGVQRAMQGALAAAVTVNTILRRPDSARLAEDFYRERQTDIAQQHRVAMRRAYGEVARFADRPFWDQRGHLTPTPVPTPLPEPAPAALLRRSDAVEIIVSASLVGDFVEAHRALRHPHLPGPIAFVGDRPIVPLLLTLPRLACYSDMTERLAQLIGPQSGSAILQWLLRRRILETVHDSDRNEPLSGACLTSSASISLS